MPLPPRRARPPSWRLGKIGCWGQDEIVIARNSVVGVHLNDTITPPRADQS
jgi:hypothetical protein